MTDSPTAPADADVPRYRYNADLAKRIEQGGRTTGRRGAPSAFPTRWGSLAPADGSAVPDNKMFVQDMFPYPSGRSASGTRWDTSPPMCARYFG